MLAGLKELAAKHDMPLQATAVSADNWPAIMRGMAPGADEGSDVIISSYSAGVRR